MLNGFSEDHEFKMIKKSKRTNLKSCCNTIQNDFQSIKIYFSFYPVFSLLSFLNVQVKFFPLKFPKFNH